MVKIQSNISGDLPLIISHAISIGSLTKDNVEIHIKEDGKVEKKIKIPVATIMGPMEDMVKNGMLHRVSLGKVIEFACREMIRLINQENVPIDYKTQ